MIGKENRAAQRRTIWQGAPLAYEGRGGADAAASYLKLFAGGVE